MIWVLITILAMLGGLGKAVRDIVENHFEISIFSDIKNEYWFKWFRSHGNDRAHHLIWFLWDAWHCGDTLSYAGLLIPMVFVDKWLQVGVCALIMGCTFQLFYHSIFRKREFRWKKLDVRC